MALKFQTTLILALACASAAIRARDPKDMKELVSDSVTICGNDDIWDDITSPKSVNAIRGIGWKRIDGIMQGFVSNHKDLVEASETVINNLKKKIAEKEEKESSRPLTQEEIESLVKQAVEHETSFTSKEAAEATACGKPGLEFNGQRFSPEAFDNSNIVMTDLARSFFTPSLESDVSTFTTKCEDYLGFKRTGDDVKDDLESYCDELCNELAQTVQAVSNEIGAGPQEDLRKLKKELAKEQTKKEGLYGKQKQCEDAIKKIDRFHKYIDDLAGDMSSKFKAFKKAEWALFDAEEVWKKLTKNFIEQQNAVDTAMKGLTDLGQAATKANDEMLTADAAMKDSKEKFKVATDEWTALREDMEGLRAAEKYADEVKEKLSLLLLSMDDYAEECVREPVRNIGLYEEADVYDTNFFTWEVKTLPAKVDMNSALSAFHDYCENTAKGIFDKVKAKVDLSPLCDLQPQTETLKQIVSTVQARKDKVVEAITDVQSWLNPFKGTDVTEATEQPDYVAHGEPLGLRRVMSMGLEQFYSGYLKKWKKYGEFLTLLGGLSVAITDLDSKLQQAADHMTGVAGELAAAEDHLENAVAVFKQAETDANLEKEDLKNVLQGLEDKVKQAKNTLEDLKLKVAEARKQWKDAEKTLLAQHSAASSLAERYASTFKLE